MRKKIDLRMIRNLIFFILLIVITFWFIFKDQSLEDLVNNIKSTNIFYLILGALLMLGYHLTESHNIRCILHALGERKISLLKALKFTLIGFFFSSITPAATGGQPIEIYYMTKEKISGPKATMSSLIILCGFQISTITLGIICAILNPSTLKGGLIWIYLVGITINGAALFFLLVCVFSQKLTKKITDLFMLILKKLKIKNLDKKRMEIEKGLKKYNKSSEFIKTHMNEFIKAIIRGFIQIIFYYSVPYCIYKALGLNSYNLFQFFTMQAVLFTTVSALPLPGSIGISETIFLKIFENAFGKNLISASMLLSRGVTFYLYVIISLIVVVTNAIKMKNVKGEIDKKVKIIEKENLYIRDLKEAI